MGKHPLCQIDPKLVGFPCAKAHFEQGKALSFVGIENMNLLTTIGSRVSSITAAALFAGCTTPQTAVEPIPAQTPISEICIQENPKVVIPEVLSLIEQAISRHGLRSTTYRDIPNSCTYVLQYVAFYTWLGKPTFKDRGLGRANIDLYQDKKLIGSARYVIPREPRDGRADPERAISTKAKLDPLLDELFKYFPGRKGQ